MRARMYHTHPRARTRVQAARLAADVAARGLAEAQGGILMLRAPWLLVEAGERLKTNRDGEPTLESSRCAGARPGARCGTDSHSTMTSIDVSTRPALSMTWSSGGAQPREMGQFQHSACQMSASCRVHHDELWRRAWFQNAICSANQPVFV